MAADFSVNINKTTNVKLLSHLWLKSLHSTETDAVGSNEISSTFIYTATLNIWKLADTLQTWEGNGSTMAASPMPVQFRSPI